MKLFKALLDIIMGLALVSGFVFLISAVAAGDDTAQRTASAALAAALFLLPCTVVLFMALECLEEINASTKATAERLAQMQQRSARAQPSSDSWSARSAPEGAALMETRRTFFAGCSMLALGLTALMIGLLWTAGVKPTRLGCTLRQTTFR